MLYKIAIVDDRAQVLQALVEDITTLGGAEVVFTARNGSEYLTKMKQLAPEARPQVVLIDIEMPVMDGIEAVKTGSVLYTGTQYIMFTIFDGDDKLFEALKAGASGYLLKHERGDAVLAAIHELVENNGAPMSSSIARKTLRMLAAGNAPKSQPQPAAGNVLTARETDILTGLVTGLEYKQLAIKLAISHHTVRNHIKKIYAKLHVSNKAQAIKLATKNNWLGV